MVDREFVEQLRTEWSTLERLCSDLTADEWQLPTDCPGWTVKDQLAHVVGTESHLAGEQTPRLDGRPQHVRNELAAFNEAWIESLRDLPGDEVLSRFADVTRRRLGELRAMTDEQLLAETDSPVGPIPYHRFMGIRVMDCWVHEQDIRHAVGRPGGLDGPVAEVAVDRLLQTLGYVVGKRVRPPEGSAVVVRLRGPVHRERAVRMSEGRAVAVDPPAEPTSVLATDSGTFARLAAGRWGADDAVGAGLVEFVGDTELAGSVLAQLATTP